MPRFLSNPEDAPDVREFESYDPNPSQLRFHQAVEKYRETAYVGGFGSGKTMAVVQQIVDLAARFPGTPWAIMRDTMGDIRDTIQQTFFEVCPQEMIYGYRKSKEVVMLNNGSQIMFRSFRQYKTSSRNQFEGKIKGLNLAGFGIDEMNEITMDQWILLLGRLRHHGTNMHRGFGSTNPPDKSHWIYTRFADPKTKAEGTALVQASTYDNKENLPPDYIPSLLASYPESWVKRYLNGEFGTVMRGDPFYEDFMECFDKDANRPWHCRNLVWMRHVPVHRYWDFGFQRPACVWGQVDVEGRWKIQFELMGNKETIFKFAPRVLEITSNRYPGASVTDFGDPAGQQKSDKEKEERSTIDILKDDFGIDIIRKFSQIQTGGDIIQKKLSTVIHGEPALQIDPEGCPVLVDGFKGGYATEKPADGRGMVTRIPIKDGFYEHLQDALRYGAVNVFGSSSKKGDMRNFEIPQPSYGFGNPGNPGSSSLQSAPPSSPRPSRGWVLNQ